MKYNMITKYKDFVNENNPHGSYSGGVYDADTLEFGDPHTWVWDNKRKENYCKNCGATRYKHKAIDHDFYKYLTPSTNSPTTGMPYCVSAEKEFNPIRGKSVSAPVSTKSKLPDDVRTLMIFKKNLIEQANKVKYSRFTLNQTKEGRIMYDQLTKELSEQRKEFEELKRMLIHRYIGLGNDDIKDLISNISY